MKKEIKDYLHLYLGSKHRYKFLDADGFSLWLDLLPHHLARLEGGRIEKIELALKPLSILTKEDFYSYGSATDNEILITAEVNDFWCIAGYDKEEYQERVDNNLSIDSADLIYDLEEADYDNVLSCDKSGAIAFGCSDEMRWFVGVQPQAAWINYLRKNHFDCDGLIEDGLAVNLLTI